MNFVYEIQPGESIVCLGDGRTIVAHPDRPPKEISADGVVTVINPDYQQAPSLKIGNLIR